MATFAQTTSPTSFGIFDSDGIFQDDADKMVTYVKRFCGEDILSVELSKKQIWSCFEEASLKYGALISEYQAKSQILTFLGMPTGSLSGSEGRYPRENLEFLMRAAEPYAMEAGIGGSYDTISGSIDLEMGRQDYDIYNELKDSSGAVIFSSGANSSPRTRLKIREVMHFNPNAAYRFFDTTSAINYLNNEFSFESFTPETIFYVLPVFEDVLRANQISTSQRVRRSNFSYKVMGTKIRIFPQPTAPDPKKLFIRVQFRPDPLNPSYEDSTNFGVSNISNIPFGNIVYSRINAIGKQWIRNYTLALSKELLGLIRSKFSVVPIPGSELTLNGSELISHGREDKETLTTQLREMLETMTYDKLNEIAAARAESINKQLRFIPPPNGGAIITG